MIISTRGADQKFPLLVWFGELPVANYEQLGWRDASHICHPPMDRLLKTSPTHSISVNEESSGRVLDQSDRRFVRKVTQVGSTPATYTLPIGERVMQTPVDIGADISKDYVNVSCATHVFPNAKLLNRRAVLLAWLKRLPAGTRIGMEATATYHELLASLAHRLGLVVYVLNAKDVHHYAKATAQRAKTDRVDAALIARYVAKEHNQLHVWYPACPAQRQLQRLMRRRGKLTRTRASLRSSLQGVPSLRSDLRALLKHFDSLIAKLDTQARALVSRNVEREQAFGRLDDIPAVGNAVGIALLATLERWALPRANSFVAFLGLDPRADESGTRHGRRRLSKRGDPELRRLLYTAAMSASRTRVWAPLYQRAIARGLSRVQALVVLARHIARTAWSIYTHKTQFEPARVQNS